MSLSIVADIWKALKPDLEYNSVGGAADSLVNILIDYDFETAEIKQEFRRDKDVMDALDSYIDQNQEEEEEEDYEDEEEDYRDDDSGW